MIQTFGITPDDQQVLAVRLKSSQMEATILTLGATLQDCRLTGHDHPLVLGFQTLENYLSDSACHGAIAGRVINRISNASALIDGTQHSFDRNFLKHHTLHGGHQGYDRRNWTITDHGSDFVALNLIDPDGHMGFPGQVTVRCRYALIDPAGLSITIRASTDAPTIFNVGHHSYFCLDDSGDIRKHELMINADRYLPSRDGDFPAGDIEPVDGGHFDFRTMRQIGRDYDHNFCLSNQRQAPRQVASLRSPESGVGMDVITSEPGLQLYTAHQLSPSAAGLLGQIDGAYAGLCLEPQMWPDAPANPAFPSIDLMPDASYHQYSEFQFHKPA